MTVSRNSRRDNFPDPGIEKRGNEGSPRGSAYYGLVSERRAGKMNNRVGENENRFARDIEP